MEFLSEQFDVANNVFPVNLVIQSAESVSAGYDAAATGNFIVANLSFNPSSAFHEYRIDFVPGKVHFYADSELLGSMDGAAIPTQPGHLILSQWSNGNALWSSGPPVSDAVMAVSYVKAYFNSSSLESLNNATDRCSKNSHSSSSVCEIPSQVQAPDPAGPDGHNTAATFFFSNEKNMTVGQMVYRQGASSLLFPWALIMLVLFAGLAVEAI